MQLQTTCRFSHSARYKSNIAFVDKSAVQMKEFMFHEGSDVTFASKNNYNWKVVIPKLRHFNEWWRIANKLSCCNSSILADCNLKFFLTLILSENMRNILSERVILYIFRKYKFIQRQLDRQLLFITMDKLD